MKKTNIVFILTDDQGVWACGCYGNPEIRTPNIDRIAETGLRCDNFFAATPVCSPSRASLLTGRIPSQHGIHDYLSGGNVGPESINYLENELCYTDILSQNGWTCGISGKWHLGASQIPQHGFTDWFVHQTGGGDYNTDKSRGLFRRGALFFWGVDFKELSLELVSKDTRSWRDNFESDLQTAEEWKRPGFALVEFI